jgi:hypothetical protein
VKGDGVKQALIFFLDLLAAKARLVLLFLALAWLTVMMQMVLAGAGWFALVFFGCLGLMLILLCWLLITFWVKAASQMMDRNV